MSSLHAQLSHSLSATLPPTEPTEDSPVFSLVLTGASTHSSVRGPWDPNRLDAIVQAARIHDVHWQGAEGEAEEKDQIELDRAYPAADP